MSTQVSLLQSSYVIFSIWSSQCHFGMKCFSCLQNCTCKYLFCFSYILSRALLQTRGNLLAVWPVFTAMPLPWHWQWGALPRGSLRAAGDLRAAGRGFLLPANPHQHLCGIWRPSLPHLRWLPLSLPGNLLLPVGSSLLGGGRTSLLQRGGQKWEPWGRFCFLA